MSEKCSATYMQSFSFSRSCFSLQLSVETVLEAPACCTPRTFEKYFRGIKVRDTYQDTGE
jgi:hypothetical protein